MANWDYRSSYFNSSWIVSSDQGRKVTASLSMRTTIDQPNSSTTRSRAQVDPFQLYRYVPLHEPGHQIRVLHLKPGSGNAILSGHFSVIKTDFDNNPEHDRLQYDALSYVWGDPHDQQPFVLGGVTIYIQQSLANALHAIRLPTASKVIWVDALCINQDDIEEKSRQVSQMDTTYRRASQVLAWLGSGNAHSAIGMQALAHMSRSYVEGRDFWYPQSPEVIVPAIQDIMTRPYWSRIWVVQESALAKKVVLVCGNDRLSWKNNLESVLVFMRSVKLAVISPGWPNGLSIDPLVELFVRQLESGPDAVLWARRKPNADILAVAYDMRHRQATDARDKIYAILGLFDAATIGQIAPDYAQSVEEAFEEFFHLVESQSAMVLAQLTQPPEVVEASDGRGSQSPGIARHIDTGPGNARPVATGRFAGGAESLCLEAVRLMGAGQLAEASRLLGRASIILNSDLEAQKSINDINDTLPRIEATEHDAIIQRSGTW